MADQFSYYEQIDRYLTKQMSGAELADFEYKIALNQELKEEVDIQIELRDVVLGASLDEELRSLMNNDMNKTTPKRLHKLWWLTGLSFVASAIIVGLIVKTDNQTVEPVLNEHVSTNTSQATTKNHPAQQQQKEIKIEETNTPIQETSVDQILPIEKNVLISNTAGDVPLTIATRNEIDQEPAKYSVLDSIKPLPKNEAQTSKKDLQPKKEPLQFKGKLKVQKSDNKQGNGKITIDGDVFGGKPPYRYFIAQDDLQNDKSFDDLAPGKYTVKAVDANTDILQLGEAVVLESKCITDYNKSFVPAYDNYWVLPVVENNVYIFKVYNQSGIVYEHKYEIGDENQWNGETVIGEMADVGYYRFEIKYSSGEQCFGELTIGN